MKRSRQLKLSLLSVAPMVFSACSSEEDLTYESLGDCLEDDKTTPAACSTAYQKANEDHLARSPRFASQGDCAGQYGNCQYVQTSSGSFWLPLMAGFMAGRWSSNYGSSGRPYIDTRGDWSPRPLYRTRDDWDRGTYSTTGGYTYQNRKSGTSWSSGDDGHKSGKISTATLSRGGFGGTSMARGGWGGGS